MGKKSMYFKQDVFNVIAAFKESCGDLIAPCAISLNLAPLVGGLSKASLYRFDYNQRSYVIRILPPHLDHAIRMKQVVIAKNAGEIGVGPNVYFVGHQLHAIIMEFIPGRTVSPADFKEADKLKRFAEFLGHLHKSPQDFPLARSPFDRFDDFLKKGKQSGQAYPSRFEEAEIVMHKIQKVFNAHCLPLVPTHLDLHPLNIMMHEADFSLVDWVNGGKSYASFDLATFSVFHELDDDREQIFLTHYFGRSPTEFEWNCFIIAKPVRFFVIAAAFLTQTPEDVSPAFYDNVLMDDNIISLHDFVNKQIAGEMILPHWQIGLMMLKVAFELVDSSNFKNALSKINSMPIK